VRFFITNVIETKKMNKEIKDQVPNILIMIISQQKN